MGSPSEWSFWSVSASDVLAKLSAGPQGLGQQEARQRLLAQAPRLLRPRKRAGAVSLASAQFRSPLVLILCFAAVLSFFLRDRADAMIIMVIVSATATLGAWQERGAAAAVDRLLAMVQVTAKALRDGVATDVPADEVVPGDVLLISAGSLVPADCLLLESKDLFVNEASLTGETLPVEKQVGTVPADAPLAGRTNALFMGSQVVSGTATAVIVRIGVDTEFGKVSQRLRLRPPETEFERGVRRFGYFLAEVTLVLTVIIFAVNVFLHRPVLDSFLFSLALAVGLTPQLLPAIVTVNLAHGARQMAASGVIVKQPTSIENLGSMNVLCSDKTGTLTEGRVTVHRALDCAGANSEKVLLYAYLNAVHETGFTNPIDNAIREHRQLDVSAWHKLDEVPYDFVRKRLTVLLSTDRGNTMVTKGSVEKVLEVCSRAETQEGQTAPIQELQKEILRRFEESSQQGYRTLGIAYREVGGQASVSRADEVEMTFLGLLLLADPPKPEAAETVGALQTAGITLKVVTGDSRSVAAHISRAIGLPEAGVLTGGDLRQMSDEALLRQADEVGVFAEVEPNQKERIILALRKSGNVVGYMGDGINDASALHAADVGISVDTGADVAKEAAHIVLLEKDLGVLLQGIRAGRTTFANTLKYVFMATSANFGNMFSMAVASLFLPFLPLLPKQILLTNLMTDLPEMTIAGDSVDAETAEQPRRWDIRFIRSFMVTFGVLSSVFDLATFGVLLFLLNASTTQFRTGWFVESVVSASLIVLVIRTRRRFWQSRPARALVAATVCVVVAAAALPFTPLAGLLGLAALPPAFGVALAGIVVAYAATAELTKWVFYRRDTARRAIRG
jgi:Mg2+-importing ATPase